MLRQGLELQPWTWLARIQALPSHLLFLKHISRELGWKQSKQELTPYCYLECKHYRWQFCSLYCISGSKFFHSLPKYNFHSLPKYNFEFFRQIFNVHLSIISFPEINLAFIIVFPYSFSNMNALFSCFSTSLVRL